jgi:hypothetical protein
VSEKIKSVRSTDAKGVGARAPIKVGNLCSARHNVHYREITSRSMATYYSYKDSDSICSGDFYRFVEVDDVMIYLGKPNTPKRSTYHYVLLDGERVYVEFNQKRFKKIQ